MSIELKYLALTAMLTASLWIPYVVSQVMTNGFLTPPNYVDPAQRPVPLWGQRADRVYMNAVETFAPFAALVLVIQITGKADAMTAFWVQAFFWLRVAARRRLLGGDPLYSHRHFHAGLRLGDRPLRRIDEVARGRPTPPRYGCLVSSVQDEIRDAGDCSR